MKVCKNWSVLTWKPWRCRASQLMSCSQIPSDLTTVSQLVHVACSNALHTPSPSSVCTLWGEAKSSQMHPNLFYFGVISFHPLPCVCLGWFLLLSCVCWWWFLLLCVYSVIPLHSLCVFRAIPPPSLCVLRVIPPASALFINYWAQCQQDSGIFDQFFSGLPKFAFGFHWGRSIFTVCRRMKTDWQTLLWQQLTWDHKLPPQPLTVAVGLCGVDC